MQHLQGQSTGDIESLKTENASLEAKVLNFKEQRDAWESDANFVKEQLKLSEQQRHETEETADAIKKEMAALLEADKARALQEMNTRDKLLKGESEARKEQWKKMKSMENELKQLRHFKAQFLSLASSLKEDGSVK